MTTLQTKADFNPHMVDIKTESNLNNQSINEDNFSDEGNSCVDENINTLNMSAKASLKRKRIAEASYTAISPVFENHLIAKDHVQSLGVWKFEVIFEIFVKVKTRFDSLSSMFCDFRCFVF